MNRKWILILIVVICFTILSGCIEVNKQQEEHSSNSKEKFKNEEVLSKDIETLLSEDNFDLELKQVHGEYHPASREFTQRISDKLQEYRLIEEELFLGKSFDVILKFKDYEELYLNTTEGYFWFDEAQDVYEIVTWNNTFWERHILKEIDGKVTYYGFEEDVLSRNYISLLKEGERHEVVLYYDGDIRLRFKDQAVTVLPNVPEDSIESLVPTNQITTQLYSRIDSKNQKGMFLVGSKYSFTNRYGSTAWLSCYEYEDSELKEVWNIEYLASSKIIVKDYDGHTLTLEIDELGIELKIRLTQEEISRINEYIAFLEEVEEEFIGKEDYLFFAIMSQYKFLDYDNDGYEELVTKVHMRGGAAGITESLFFIYNFTEEGIELKDILPAREYVELSGAME